jgi:hypothetical protein
LLSGVPHLLQNREPAAFSIPQIWQRIRTYRRDHVIGPLVSLSVGKEHRAKDSALLEQRGALTFVAILLSARKEASSLRWSFSREFPEFLCSGKDRPNTE